MKAIELSEPHRLKLVDRPEPSEPGPGEVLVRTHSMGICGTDVSGFLGRMPFFRYPRIPGHELGVEVLAVGPDVNTVRPGDRCSVEPYLNCGGCYACRSGHPNCCESLNVIGVMVDGGLCDRFLIRSDRLHPSEQLSMEQLALVETLAIGCHAAERGGALPGQQVLIIGAGPIGLATLEFTRLKNARITVMDISPQRLDFCRRHHDVDHTIQVSDQHATEQRVREITDGAGFAVVTDATGNADSMSSALSFAAHSGTVVYVGITTGTIQFPHPVLHRPELTLRASRNALPDDFRRIIGLIEDGTIDTAPWITHRIPFDSVTTDFESLTQPDSGVVKAMIDVSGCTPA